MVAPPEIAKRYRKNSPTVFESGITKGIDRTEAKQGKQLNNSFIEPLALPRSLAKICPGPSSSNNICVKRQQAMTETK